jgi:hypothetical protein
MIFFEKDFLGLFEMPNFHKYGKMFTEYEKTEKNLSMIYIPGVYTIITLQSRNVQIP